ncbi:hypothetical protein DH2020_047878 [Rehmannia glutinosa]|uniref:Uncharacterized protein n=1 Tax=Rehmannia glutinosa TaxID=99300 RepID=A0ABR0U7L2_REHGL
MDTKLPVYTIKEDSLRPLYTCLSSSSSDDLSKGSFIHLVPLRSLEPSSRPATPVDSPMHPDKGLINVRFPYASSRFTNVNRLYKRVGVMKVGLSTKEKAKKYVKSMRIGIISHTSESGRIHWSKRNLGSPFVDIDVPMKGTGAAFR